MKWLVERKLPLTCAAVLLLWIKTFIVYLANFHIDTENTLQNWILWMNPLSFLLFVLGLGQLWKKAENQVTYVVAISLILSLLLYANVVFYRFFNDYLTLPLLFQTNNFGDLGNSAWEEFQWYDFFFFTDVLLLFLIVKRKPSFISFQPFSTISRRAYFYVAASLLCLNLGLAETERPQLLTRTFDREALVKNIGIYYYDIYDILLQSKSSAQRALADSSELSDIENYIHANDAKPSDKWFGIAQGKNVIVISMESMQNFVINHKVNGQEITPFLNRLIKNSLYFDNFYHQTGQGKTSDSEFLLENSLYPLGRGAVFFTNSGNTYYSMAKKLKNSGYYTAAMHANNKSFWNRDIMYPALGYDRFYSADDYHITPENVINWGLKDIPFFDQSAKFLEELPNPFYAKLITLTNHHPFYYSPEDQKISEFTSNDGTVNRYFVTARYTDEAVERFLEKLKKNGLYDRSIIVLYGDHYGISQNHNEAMSQYLGREITPLEAVKLQKVPCIIHIPGMKKGMTIHEVAGQIDLRPTILHLLGIETKYDIQFGHDLLSHDHSRLVVFRDGSFVTNHYVYTRNQCYEQESGKLLDRQVCSRFSKTAQMELSYSDRIIYGDLLRFYKDK
ncbi:LTA synthase family protein [Bacillus smithii]|uniref:LTA synthase family protein n=1 Tax=Bacillus smithii TaxID=1479 RepID=UPI003D1E2686